MAFFKLKMLLKSKNISFGSTEEAMEQQKGEYSNNYNFGDEVSL